MASIFDSAVERKTKVAKDRKRKLERMDSDDEMTDESDEYASVHFSDDEMLTTMQKQSVMDTTQQNQKVEEVNEEAEDDDEGEDEMDQTTSALNADQKKKAKEEDEARFDVSLLDRIMRTRDRYLRNPAKHPGYQIEDVKKTVIQKTLILSQMLKKKLSVYVRSTVITFITILVYHRDYAAKLKRERIFKVTDFGW